MPEGIQITSWGPPQGGGADTLAGAMDPSSIPQGQELLDRLKKEEPGMAAVVQATLEGRQAFPSGFMQKTPYGMRISQYANAIDPTFDGTNYAARQAQRKNYEGGGKQFQEMQSIGTVAGHIQNLAHSADALNNFENLGPLNYPANYVRSAYRGLEQDPAISKFNTDKQAVMTELGKAYRGGTLTEGELNKWMDTLSTMSTPSQVKTVIGELNSLLGSKRTTLEDGYKRTMSPFAKMPAQFTAESEGHRKIFENVDKWSKGKEPYQSIIEPQSAGGAGQPAAAPKPGFYVYDPATKQLKPAQ